MALQNLEDFLTRYRVLCSQSKVCSSRIIPKLIRGTELKCQVESVMSWHWPIFLRTLCTDNSLTKVEFCCNLSPTSQKQTSPRLQKIMDKYYPLPYGCSAVNISNICQAVATMLVHSEKIVEVRLENLVLTRDDILILADSLSCSKVKLLSFAESLIDDDSLEILCRKLYHSKISWIDFSSCQISGERLKSVCRLLKYNKNNKARDLYFLGLRNQTPVLDEMMGISRVTLNNNEVGDDGVELIMGSLEDDLWLKVLDLQNCDIGNAGAKCIFKTLKYNVTFQDVDLRQNDIDPGYLEKVSLQLSLNNAGKELKYTLGRLWKPRQYTIRNPRRILRSKKIVKTCPIKLKLLPKKSNSSLESAFKFSLNTKSITIEDASVQTDVISVLDDELKKIQRTLTNEIKLRECLMHLLKKYKMENCMLRKEIQNLSKLDDHILIDQDTFVEVKNTFEKFKRFLGVMKEYGLFECIAMLGVNENTDIVLKPLVLNATKKCMQLVENEPSSTSEAVESLLSMDETGPKAEEPAAPWFPPPDIQAALAQNGTATCFNQKKEFNFGKDKALVQRVYREVRENYGGRPSFPPKHHPRRPEMPLRKRPKGCAAAGGRMEAVSKIRQLKSPKEFYYGGAEPWIEADCFSGLTKSASSQTSCNAHHCSRKAGESPQGSSSEKLTTSDSSGKAQFSASSNSVQTSSDLSTLKNPSCCVHGLAPNSRPKLKGTTKRGCKPVAPSPLDSASISSDLVASVHASLKASLEGEQHSDNANNLAKQVSALSLGSSACSEGGKEDSGQSYLESVSDAASTDKDVQSIMESEVYSAPSSAKGKVYSAPSSAKDEVNSSPSSTKSELNSAPSSVKGEVYSAPSSAKDSQNPSVASVNQAEPSNPVAAVSKSEGSTSSKSSKRRRAKKASSLQPMEEGAKKDDSSVPSLSDITTVSSRSLNTDSVMGQISNEEA